MTTTEESITPEGIQIESDASELEAVTESNGYGLLDRLRFWRRGQTWLEIAGYHVEDIHADQPVSIEEGATLVGNVYAPRLVVSGLLSGSAVCREIRVEKSGQVLGDVFTVSMTVISGGNVHGWISNVDESDYATMVKNGRLPDDNTISPNENGLDLTEGQHPNRNEAQIEALHHLQSETAVALAARAELEQDFQRRLTELAGESTSTIASLKQELTELRTELATKQTQLDEAQEAVRHRKSQVERQTNELGIARDLMTEQNDDLTTLRQQHNKLQSNHTQLTSEKTAVDKELETAVREISTLSDRIHSLEVAHKASLTHTSDQEESLIRWQELAEITEKRANDLDTELQKAELQREESSNTISLLREQRQAIEKELEKTVDALNALQEKSAEPLATAAALTSAQSRVSELEAELADAEHAHFERVLWYKAELETNQAATATAQEEIAKLTEKLTQMEKTAQSEQEMMAERQTAVSDIQATLEVKQAEWNALHESLVEKNMTMETVVQEQKMQMDADKTELKHYLREIDTQGNHLAEIQARLVEREVQLKQAITQLKQTRDMINKQNQAIKQMQNKAGARIRSLQSQLAK
ncbi:MAG: hypothetical protein GY805_22850 [Chloroflexi bacterium]|nr:hypothetical protein [Chloroflexota bacterium]